MSKKALLERIQLHSALEGKVRKYAAMSLTDEDAALRATAIARRVRGLNVAFIIFWLLCIVLSLAMLVDGSLSSGYTVQSTSVPGQDSERAAGADRITVLFWLSWLALSLILFALVVDVVDYGADKGEKLLLEPIAGTRQCEDALNCLEEGGPLVAEWRDLALAERSQLLLYDCKMMIALRDIYKEELQSGRDRNRFEFACKKVHGLSL